MPKNFEITDENEVVLYTEFNSGRFNAVTECPMSENVIAYALEELEPGAIPNIENHLVTCRVCADLAQDVRSAADESQPQNSQPVEVLPALARAINRSGKPASIKMIRKLIPNFTIPPVYAKIAAAVATACLVFFVVQFGFRNTNNFASHPNAVEQMPAVRKELVSQPQTSNRTKPLKSTTNGPYSINSITDSRQQQADPFEPLFGAEISPSAVKKKRAKRVPLTPLEKLDFSQLKLVGIILSDKGNKGMVEDATGKGYVLKEGTYVGRNSGKVTRILKDKVIIEEEMENDDGRLIIFQRELKFNAK